MMPLYPGCGAGPSHCNCRIYLGKAWQPLGELHGIDTHELEIFLWDKFTVGDRDPNHMFFVFFWYQVGILLLSFKQTLEWLFQWWDGPRCHTATQISANLIRLLQSNLENPHYVHKKMEAERIYIICLNLYIKNSSARVVNLDLPE